MSSKRTTEDFEALGEQVARAQDEALALTEAADLAAARAVLDRAEREPPRAANSRTGWVLAAAAIALMGWAAVSSFEGERAPADALAFHASGASERDTAAHVGTWIAAGDELRVVSFSDGSTVELEPGASVRVAATDAHGATLDLERGTIEVSAIHRDDTSWRVQAGPFTVRVVGTRFRVTWRPDSERFALDLHEGEVLVEGPEVDGRAVRTGETLNVSVGDGRMELVRAGMRADSRDAPRGTVRLANVGDHDGAEEPVSEPRGERSAIADQAESGSAARAGDAERRPRASARVHDEAPVRAATDIDWRALGRDGRCAEAIAAMNLERVLRAGTAPDLLLVASCAVRIGDREPARRATAAIRSRFDGTPAAGQATYRLGTLELRRGDTMAATRLFDESLRHDGAGPYAAVAMGALLQTYERTGQHERGARMGRRYLREHPRGSHTALAERLVGQRPAVDPGR